MYLVSQIKIVSNHVSSQNSIKYCIFLLAEAQIAIRRFRCSVGTLCHVTTSLYAQVPVPNIASMEAFSFLDPVECFPVGREVDCPTIHCREGKKIHFLTPQASYRAQDNLSPWEQPATCSMHAGVRALITVVTPFHQTKTTQMQRQNQNPNLENVTWADC